jgi:hypothetical protein
MDVIRQTALRHQKCKKSYLKKGTHDGWSITSDTYMTVRIESEVGIGWLAQIRWAFGNTHDLLV